jgi:hypothetical protein
MGFRRLPFLGFDGRRLLLAMGIFIVGMLVVLIESMFFNFIRYLDISEIGPLVLVVVIFLAIVIFSKRIKNFYRAELAFVVGIFCILFGILSSLLLPEYSLTNPFIFAPFWIFFGIICFIVGNELLGQISSKEKLEKIAIYAIIASGGFLFITFLIRIIEGEYENGLLTLNFIVEISWLTIGGILVSHKFLRRELKKNMLVAFKISLFIGIGLLFILFGAYLATLSRFIEGIIEIMLGVIIFIYGIMNNIFLKNKSEMLAKLSFPVLLIISESITFYLVLFN